MEFGKHIGKGLWAFGDKALPAVYGLGYVFLVIRVLPEQEYGAFVIIQTIFLFASALGTSFALQPLTKFAAEHEDHTAYIVASITMNVLFYALVSLLVLLFKRALVPLLDPNGKSNLMLLLNYLPLLFAAALYRSFAIALLQARYAVQKIFWIDSVYFLGVLVLIYVAQTLHRFSSAEDLVLLNVIALAAASFLALILTGKSISVKLSVEREAFSKMWHFGKFTFGGNALYSFFSQVDVFFISSMVGIVAVAVYNSAKILTRLFDMLSQVLQMFLIPFSSKAYSEKETEKLTVVAEKSVCFSTIFVVPLFIIMFFFPEQLLHILYKGKYDQGASVLRALSFLAFIVPWNATVTSYLIGMGKVKQGFYAGIGLLGISLPAYAVLTPILGALGTSVGLVTTFSIVTIFLAIYLHRLIPIGPLRVLMRTSDVLVFIRRRILPTKE